MILPPNTRGFILSTFDSPDTSFLHWYELGNFLDSTLLNLHALKKEGVKNELYSALIEYNPDTTVLWLKLAKLNNGMLGLAHGNSPRPYTLNDLSKRFNITSDKLLSLYYIWDSSSCTPEEAAEQVGLNIKTVIELAEYFEDTIPPNV